MINTNIYFITKRSDRPS